MQQMPFGARLMVVFPILVCNQSCSYCVNHYGDHTDTIPSRLNYPLQPGAQWMRALQSISGIEEMHLTGGEPCLHPDFAMLANARPDVRLSVATNCSEKSLAQLAKVKPRPNLWIQSSYHPTQTSAQDYAARVRRLRSSCGYPMGIHKVGDMSAEEKEYFRKETGLHMTNHPFISYGTGEVVPDHRACKPKLPTLTVRCPVADYKLVAPNGDIYICHNFMYGNSKEGILGNVFSGWIAEGTHIVCSKYGWCHACDLGRFGSKEVACL